MWGTRIGYLAGIGAGCTLPQSELLKTEEESTVHSTGTDFGPACIVPRKCTLPVA